MTRTEAKALVAALVTLRESAADKEASCAAAAYPRLKADGTLIPAGTRLNVDGVLWRAAADVWDDGRNTPSAAPALWERLAYRDGYRLIPEVLTVGTAFAKGECGWWAETLYESLLDANVWTPADNPAGWKEV